MRVPPILKRCTGALFLEGSIITLCSAQPNAATDSAVLFEAEIAPLFANHCLECHDTRTNKGRLGLSRRDKAMAVGESGVVIVPGRFGESLLWESVHEGDMPEDRPPLSAEEKKALKAWIDGGAVWASETIDPLAYDRDRRAALTWVWRLTVREYIETVRSALGVDIEGDARRILPPESSGRPIDRRELWI